MASNIDVTVPQSGVAASKAALRDNFLRARDEITALQAALDAANNAISIIDASLTDARNRLTVLEAASAANAAFMTRGQPAASDGVVGSIAFDFTDGKLWEKTVADGWVAVTYWTGWQEQIPG